MEPRKSPTEYDDVDEGRLNNVPAGQHWRSPPFDAPYRFLDTVTFDEYLERLMVETDREDVDRVPVVVAPDLPADKFDPLADWEDDS